MKHGQLFSFFNYLRNQIEGFLVSKLESYYVVQIGDKSRGNFTRHHVLKKINNKFTEQ